VAISVRKPKVCEPCWRKPISFSNPVGECVGEANLVLKPNRVGECVGESQSRSPTLLENVLAKPISFSNPTGLENVLAKANLVFPKKEDCETYRLKIDCEPER
jgi:hypothetical protein